MPPLIKQGIELYTCAGLIAALRVHRDLGEVTESPQFNAYAECMAVALVADGRRAPNTSFDLQHAGELIYRNLDLATATPSSTTLQATDAIDVLKAGKQLH